MSVWESYLPNIYLHDCNKADLYSFDFQRAALTVTSMSSAWIFSTAEPPNVCPVLHTIFFVGPAPWTESEARNLETSTCPKPNMGQSILGMQHIPSTINNATHLMHGSAVSADRAAVLRMKKNVRQAQIDEVSEVLPGETNLNQSVPRQKIAGPQISH
jgi:hypothetical protein